MEAALALSWVMIIGGYIAVAILTGGPFGWAYGLLAVVNTLFAIGGMKDAIH